jgi:hypothetical protein
MCKRRQRDIIHGLPVGNRPHSEFETRHGDPCRVSYRYLARCHDKDSGSFECQFYASEEGSLAEFLTHLATHSSWEFEGRVPKKHFVQMERRNEC